LRNANFERLQNTLSRSFDISQSHFYFVDASFTSLNEFSADTDRNFSSVVITS
jgi:hypothetical protein